MKYRTIATRLPWRVTAKFAWYDLWVGAYIDRSKRTVYICPVPMVLLVVRYG